jgi:precorrin-3B synthase
MPTGDGLLVRLTPAGPTIRPEALMALCTAARSCGNGVIEITSRGSIQIRGLTEVSVQRFAAAVGAIDMALSDDPPVLCDPLAGLDREKVLDATAIAAELRVAIAAEAFATDLGPKISVVIDGGGALHLDAVPADVRLRAQVSGDRVSFQIALGGDAATATPVAAVAVEHAIEAALSMLRVIAARGPTARARDIVATDDAAAFRRAIDHVLVDLAPPSVRPSADPIGRHALRDGRVAIGFGLAFGHVDSTTVAEVARAAERAGASGLRTAPGRALLVVGLGADGASHLADIAARLGLIVDARDARRQVVACAGAPICAAAEIPSRALAPSLASNAPLGAASAAMVHVSGCAKGCACPRAVPLTVVGIEGRCGVVVNGSARDRPLVVLTPAELPSGLARLADAARQLCAPDESLADVLSRLDHARIARLLLGEATSA